MNKAILERLLIIVGLAGFAILAVDRLIRVVVTIGPASCLLALFLFLTVLSNR